MRGRLHPRLAGGTFMRALAPFGPVTMSHGDHGSEAASWTIDPDFRHPLLRSGVLVEIFDGGANPWTGTLLEPTTSGEVHAVGLWRSGESSARDTAGQPTTNLTAAVDAGQARGEVRFGRLDPLPAVPWSSDDTTQMSIVGLADKVSTSQGVGWWVDPSGVMRFAAAPTVPDWVIPNAVAGQGIGLADDEFFTHLVGTYIPSPGVRTNVTVGDDAAAAAFYYRSQTIDLTSRGILTEAQVIADLTGILTTLGPRMSFTEGFELDRGQIFTLGGVPVPLEMVRARQMVRAMGVVDKSRPGRISTTLDVVLGTSEYAEEADHLRITPVGKVARNVAEIFALIGGKAA